MDENKIYQAQRLLEERDRFLWLAGYAHNHLLYMNITLNDTNVTNLIDASSIAKILEDVLTAKAEALTKEIKDL